MHRETLARGKRADGEWEKDGKEEGQKTTRLAGWEETRAVRPEDGVKPMERGKERVEKMGVWRFSAGQKG